MGQQKKPATPVFLYQKENANTFTKIWQSVS